MQSNTNHIGISNKKLRYREEHSASVKSHMQQNMKQCSVMHIRTTLCQHKTNPVASLGSVSPAAATDGVTLFFVAIPFLVIALWKVMNSF